MFRNSINTNINQCRYQKEQYNHTDSLLEQIMRIHETEHQMQLPKFTNMSSTPTSV